MTYKVTYKQWPCACACGFRGKVFAGSNALPPKCPECSQPTTLVDDGPIGQAASVIPDDIPGGLDIYHGLCNADGSPRRYYSRSEIRREAERRGLTILGETPKPHRARWV